METPERGKAWGRLVVRNRGGGGARWEMRVGGEGKDESKPCQRGGRQRGAKMPGSNKKLEKKRCSNDRLKEAKRRRK